MGSSQGKSCQEYRGAMAGRTPYQGIKKHIEDLKMMFIYAPDTRIKEHPVKVAGGEWTSAIGVMKVPSPNQCL